MTVPVFVCVYIYISGGECPSTRRRSWFVSLLENTDLSELLQFPHRLLASLSLSLLIRISIYINTSPAISPSAYSLGASALYADLLVILISDLLNVLSSTPDKTCVVEVSTFNNSRIARSPPVLKNVTKDWLRRERAQSCYMHHCRVTCNRCGGGEFNS